MSFDTNNQTRIPLTLQKSCHYATKGKSSSSLHLCTSYANLQSKGAVSVWLGHMPKKGTDTFSIDVGCGVLFLPKTIFTGECPK